MPATKEMSAMPLKAQNSAPRPSGGAEAGPSLAVDACGRFAGQLQLVGLSRLRQHLGANWEKYRPKIHTAVENIISTHLSPKDMSSSVGQDHYILIFDEHTTPDQAEEISIKIAQTIRQVFIGESHSDLIEVRSQVGQIQQTELDDIIFAPLKDRPAQLASEVMTKHDPIKSLALKEEQAKKAEAAKLALAEKIAKEAKAKNFATKAQAPYEIEYLPFWNIHNEILTGYAVMAVRHRAVGPPILEHNVLQAGSTVADIQKLDAQLLKSQIEVGAELYQNDFTSLLTTHVHFDTLSCAKGREEILTIARQIPAALKPIVMIEIVGIPDHTPPSTVQQRAAGLNTLFRALTVRLPRLDFPVSDCVAMGATAVAFQIPAKHNRAVLMEGIKKLIHDAKEARVFTTFEYVPDIDFAAELKEAGAIFVSGPFLGGPFDTPGNMKRLTVREARKGPISPY
jgi:hypothetical protein